MRSLFAPARLQALVILGGLFALVMTTQDSCTWLEFADEDSLGRLDTENACRIAQRSRPEEACILVSSTDVAAEVRLGGGVGVTVCLLRANRWFVVDPDAASDCPTAPPFPGERVFNLRGEQKLEERWIEALRRQRDETARDGFLKLLRAAVDKWRAANDVPRTCPDFPDGPVHAIDVDITTPGIGAPWHYLTSDHLETLLANAGSWGAGAAVRNVRKQTPMLLFVDATEKKQPFQMAPGVFRGKIALIDWTRPKVFCEADVEYEQDTGAPRDPESIAEFLPDFKRQVSAVLKSTTTSMTNGHLKLADTW
ncbi:MAG: hypothetical protein JNM17_34655 [Archangium sp.]|nr:hypothetical protein [Archangium sp.]